MAQLFFYLDGTIINSQGRLYNLFCELCPENKFSYNEYWEIKRTHMLQKDFLKRYFQYSDEKIDIFNKKYLERIEDLDLIKTDFPVVGIEEILRSLSQKHTLYVVTNRQNKSKTIDEIKSFNWFDIFKQILVTEQKISKAELIVKNITVTPDDFFISDSGEDIKTAKKLGIHSIAVTWGILNRDVLSKYQPNFIFDKVSDLLKLEEKIC